MNETPEDEPEERDEPDDGALEPRQATTAPLAVTGDVVATVPTSTAANDDDLLGRRLSAYDVALRSALADVSDGLVRAQENVLGELIADWAANLDAQIEYLKRFVEDEPSPDRLRSEVFRAARDVMRWLRKLSERSEATIRGLWKPASLGGALARAIDETDELHTLSAPLVPAVFAPSPDDGFTHRLRKSWARRRAERGDAVRGVPLRELAGRFALPTCLDAAVETVHRTGAMRVDVWRRLRAASLDIAQTFAEVDRRIADGEQIAWDALADEAGTAVDGVRDDLGRFARDILGRLDRALAGASERLRHAALRSDTFLLPPRAYEPYPTAAMLEAKVSGVRGSCGGWNTVASTSLGALGVVLDVYAFMAAVRYAHLRDAHRLREIFESSLVRPTARITERGDRALARIEAALDAPDAAEDGAHDVVEQERVEIGRLIEHGCLDALRHAGTREHFEETMDELRRSVRRAAERVSPSFGVPPRHEGAARIVEGEPPPEVHPVQFELRALADAAVNERVRVSVEAAWDSLHALLTRADEAVVELRRMVTYNLEAARDELANEGTHVDEQLVREYAIDGLTRFVERARAVRDDVHSTADRVVQTIADGVPDAMTTFEQALRDLHVETRDRIDGRTAVVSGVERQSWYDTIVGWLGGSEAIGPTGIADTPVSTTDELADLMKRATLSARAGERLPDVYWHLFADTGERDAQFRLGRAGVVERVRAVLSDWEHGDPESVALVGLRGVGKSSVLEQLRAGAIGGYPTFELSLGERVRDDAQLAAHLCEALRLPSLTSIDAIVDHIARGERSIVLVDGAENLFLRHAAGLEMMRRFLAVMTATADHVLWIVSFEQVAFEFLGAVLNLSDAFTSVIPVPPMSRREIEELVLIRHRVSGRRLRFDAAIGVTGDDAASLQRAFFDQLHAASYGHPLLAIHYWLESIATATQHADLEVRSFRPLPSMLLGPLSGQKLAGLATLMIHGALDKRSFAEAMRMSDDDAASLLGQLRHLHLAEPVPGDRDRFQVNGVAYAALHNDLKHRNVL